MATTWVLRTETKGTGAQMVPLEEAGRQPSSAEPTFVTRRALRDPRPDAPAPRAPRRFRIVDVMTRQVRLEDAGTRQALDALREVRSIVDVNVYVWQEDREKWRLLTLDEQRAMLEMAHAELPADPVS